MVCGSYGDKEFLVVIRPAKTVLFEYLRDSLALKRTCRQITTETDLLPYSKNQFYGSTQYLVPLLAGRILPTCRIPLITNLRLWLFERDVEDELEYFLLQAAVLHDLLLLRQFVGLKHMTFEFNGVSRYHEWAYMRWQLIRELKQVFKTGSAVSIVEVEVEKASW